MSKKIFGEKLKIARKKTGLTQKQLGEKTGVGQVVIANYERGARFPGEAMLRNLAESLHVSLDYLLDVSQSIPAGTVPGELSIESLFALVRENPVARVWEEIEKWKNENQLHAESIYSLLLIPLLRKTGDLWFSGQISVMDEHLVSGKVRELITLAASEEDNWNSPPVPGKSWMGLCAPGEEHDLVLLMTSHLLQLKGWDVKFAGTGMPVNDLIQAVNSFKPRIVSLSVTIDSFRAGLETYLDVLYSNRTYQYGVILGGAAMRSEDLRKFSGVIGIARSLIEGIEIAEKYVNEKGAIE